MGAVKTVAALAGITTGVVLLLGAWAIPKRNEKVDQDAEDNRSYVRAASDDDSSIEEAVFVKKE